MRLTHLQSCHLYFQNKSHCCSCFHPSCHLSPCCYLLPGLLHQLPYWSPSTCPLIYLLHNCLSEVLIFLQIFKSGHAHFSLEPCSGFQLHLESPVCSPPWPTRPLTTWLCFLHSSGSSHWVCSPSNLPSSFLPWQILGFDCTFFLLVFPWWSPSYVLWLSFSVISWVWIAFLDHRI